MPRKCHTPPIIMDAREPADPGTIGAVFDFYRQINKPVPTTAIINSDNFKSNQNGKENHQMQDRRK